MNRSKKKTDFAFVQTYICNNTSRKLSKSPWSSTVAVTCFTENNCFLHTYFNNKIESMFISFAFILIDLSNRMPKSSRNEQNEQNEQNQNSWKKSDTRTLKTHETNKTNKTNKSSEMRDGEPKSYKKIHYIYIYINIYYI